MWCEVLANVNNSAYILTTKMSKSLRSIFPAMETSALCLIAGGVRLSGRFRRAKRLCPALIWWKSSCTMEHSSSQKGSKLSRSAKDDELLFQNTSRRWM